MPEEVIEKSEQADSRVDAKLVPVGESIKYRRRAQQAEIRLQEIEQQLKDLQAQFEKRSEELADAEARRDELSHQLTTAEYRIVTERMLAEAGVVDIEAASLLLSKRMGFDNELEAEALAREVEQLLLDKPFLRGGPEASLPSKTASARQHRTGVTSQLAQAAEKAVHSGDRRDVAEYLRLRRQSSGAI